MRPQRALVDAVRAHVRESAGETGRAQLSPRVLAAMEAVPRDFFVPAHLRDAAWDDTALPIGHGQTISQPFIVALSLDLAEIEPEDTVLEVGTGSGYQSALLARLARRVYSLELSAELAATARARLSRLGVDNVEVREGDGFLGWPEHAPYDAIVVAAAPPDVPPALVDQLAPGGRLVLPVGADRWSQRLAVVSKDTGGAVSRRDTIRAAFVPMRSGTAEGAQ